LNPGPYPPHPTSTYTCGVTITPSVCGGKKKKKKNFENMYLSLSK